MATNNLPGPQNGSLPPLTQYVYGDLMQKMNAEPQWEKTLLGNDPITNQISANLPGSALNAANGVLNLGGSAIKDVQQKGWGALGDIPGAAGNLISGAAQGVNNLVGQPVGTDQSGNLQLQMPSATKALKNAVENPVGSAFSAQLVGNLSGGAVLAKPTPADAAAVGTDAAPEVTAPAPKDPMVDGPSDPSITDAQAARYGSVLKTPEEVATVPPGAKISGVDALKQAIHDQVGATNITDLDTAIRTITKGGTDGTPAVFPAITKYALDQVTDPVRINDLSSEVSGYIKDINPDGATAIRNSLPPVFNDPNLVNSPEEIITTTAPDLFKSYQDLGSLAAKFAKNASDPVVSNTIDAIKSTQDAIMETLNSVVTPDSFAALKTDPFVVSQLSRLPGGLDGPLAQRWLQNAGNLKDTSAIQYPYVILSKYVGDTVNSTFNDQMQAVRSADQAAQTRSEAMIQRLANPRQYLKSTAIDMANRGVGPSLNQTAEQTFANNTMHPTSSLPAPTAGGVLPVIGGAIKNTVSSIPSIVKTAVSNQSSKNNIPGETVVPPKSYDLPDPKSMGLLLEQDYKDQWNALNTKMGAEKLNDPGLYNQDAATQASLDKTYTAQTDLRNAYKASLTFNTLGDPVYKLAMEVPLNIFNANNWYDQIATSQDPNLQALYVAIAHIKQWTGLDLSTAKSRETLISALNAGASSAYADLQAQEKGYAGPANVSAPQTTNGGATITAPGVPTNLPDIPSAPSNGSLPIGSMVQYHSGFGHTGEGLPPLPIH